MTLRLGPAAAVVEHGSGLRFELPPTPLTGLQPQPAFVVRHAGQLRAYLNRCPHAATELDWEPGEFFDFEARWLVCASHGAQFDPATGLCLAGPCRGRSLIALSVDEVDGEVLVRVSSAAG
jgi:nitrite reductase/ring-hydroxylating ferredoxin subunit